MNKTHGAVRRSFIALAGTLVASLATAQTLTTESAYGAARPKASPAAPASATWPTRPVRLLVGFPGGSSPDLAARVLAEGLSRSLGQPVVVENRPGASGNIAADQVSKARDDHTLGLVINGNLTSAKLLNPRLPYDPAHDFRLISLVATAPLVLVTTPDQPSGEAFVHAARNGGNKWNYGSVGVGSVGHLGMEYLKTRMGGVEAVHVSYAGNPQVVTAMLSGQTQMALVPPGIALPQIRAGKLKAIGLTTGRSTLAPDIPPLSDAGVRGASDLEVWVALVGPATLSRGATDRLAEAVPQLLRNPEARQRMFSAGWQAVGGSAQALQTRIDRETNSLGGIIMMRGIRVD
ncbi:MAG: tripartite tricarboxylate transporter substrate binding protein [Variovorax sp.]|nr:tripartite tricarboxylate transporter substrate binding protein [Variovorax sp.]